MKYILLDTNILIYREGEAILNTDIQALSRLLIDSPDYNLCVHPLSINELSKYKNQIQNEVIQSEVAIYNVLQDPPLITNEFNEYFKNSDNIHGFIDNNLLYTVYENCVSYLITNDKGILKKAKIINIEDRVLSIAQAIEIFSIDNKISPKTVQIVQEEFLYNINTNDPFF